MRVIGVSGKARSGKGVFASVAEEKYGATIVSFADGVKEELGCLLDLLDARVVTTSAPWHQRHLRGEHADREELLYFLFADIPESIPEMYSFIRLYANVLGDSVAAFTPRSLMQWWGTEYRRAQDENYWVDKALAKCDGECLLYVIDDCRFENEAEAVRKAGGKLVRIERANAPVPSNPDHPSEVGLDEWDEWDTIILNGDTLGCMQDMCDVTLDAICTAQDMERA